MLFLEATICCHCGLEGLEEEVQADERLRTIISDLLHDPEKHPGFHLKDGRLHYRESLVIPKNSARIPLILQEFHDTVVGGHSGFFRTYKR